MARRSISLLTDFGYQSPYVGIMKGVIFNINPEATIIDLCHDVSAHSIIEAAFILEHSYRYFPLRTIHLVVVDPGVGTARKAILAVGERAFYIAPDNGVLSLVIASDNVQNVYEISEEHYWLTPVSDTFHGRDILAPAAAWLSKGLDSNSLGDRIESPVSIDIPAPRPVGSTIIGEVMLVDRFGNLITNIPKRVVEHIMEKYKISRFTVKIGNATSTQHVTHFAQAVPGNLASLWGSTENLEITVREERADTLAEAAPGSEVVVQFHR